MKAMCSYLIWGHLTRKCLACELLERVPLDPTHSEKNPYTGRIANKPMNYHRWEILKYHKLMTEMHCCRSEIQLTWFASEGFTFTRES